MGNAPVAAYYRARRTAEKRGLEAKREEAAARVRREKGAIRAALMRIRISEGMRKVLRVYTGLHFAHRAAGDGSVTLSRAELAKRAGVSEATAKRAIRELVSRGWLVALGDGLGGRGRKNAFAVVIDAIKMAAFPPRSPASRNWVIAKLEKGVSLARARYTRARDITSTHATKSSVSDLAVFAELRRNIDRAVEIITPPNEPVAAPVQAHQGRV